MNLFNVGYNFVAVVVAVVVVVVVVVGSGPLRYMKLLCSCFFCVV